ncbi:MAG: hypothetical protein OXF72_09880 [Gammaproteobacteria bacterium]|nr:hypothetical protein [Gammaproteobacteria bacterium]MCY4199998.1 hypothetical protein [Gammaproteobacteria bacterium]MCY4323726.1 hypothetical protein [Gammaproteobacteria bacterium]
MKRRRGYVLVTCLYVVAVLSVSSAVLVRSASLMSANTRLLDQQQSLSFEAQLILRESQILELSAGGNADCRGASGHSVHVQVLHEREVNQAGADDDSNIARYRIYAVQACADGRALMETTLGVLAPTGVLGQDDLPDGVRLGRLSWRRVW